MAEFAVLSVFWLLFVVFVAKKGTTHFQASWVPIVLPLAGGIGAALIEALPTHPLSPGFTVRTLIAVLVGVFAGRLFARIGLHWAKEQEKRAPPKPPRLVHPLIAVGLLLSGLPVLWHLITSELSLFEEFGTPRDGKTGIAHGCEEVRISKGARAGVLLLHGLYYSPADFDGLPQRLEAAGFDVLAPLYPGHGRKPDDVDAVWAADYRKAVHAAYEELSKGHERVAIVGGSMGGTLAVLEAADSKPAALVLVSPYLGRLTTPSWCPVEFDSLVGPVSRVARRMFVEQDMRGRGYATQSLHGLRQARDLTRGVDAAAERVSCPTLVLVGAKDQILPPQYAAEWTAARLRDHGRTQSFAGSGHDLFHDVEAEAAMEETVRFLVASCR